MPNRLKIELKTVGYLKKNVRATVFTLEHKYQD